MQTFNCKHTKICAFCKNWHNPSGSGVTPKTGGFFTIDEKAKRKCLVTGLDKAANCSCIRFSGKY